MPKESRSSPSPSASASMPKESRSSPLPFASTSNVQNQKSGKKLLKRMSGSSGSDGSIMWQRTPTGHFHQDLATYCKDLQLAYVPQVTYRYPKKVQAWKDKLASEKREAELAAQHHRKRLKSKSHGKAQLSFEKGTPSHEGSKTLPISPRRKSSSFTNLLPLPGSPMPTQSSQDIVGGLMTKYSDRFTFFFPCIQVDMDAPDDGRTVNAIYIRGWRLDKDLWQAMRFCWPAQERLSALHFYRAGLDESSLRELCSILLLCQRLTTVVLDNNNLDTDALSGLLAPNSILQHLSLCFCSITDSSVVHLAEALGSPTSVNASLLTLRLTGNQIGDQGAGALADALKLNNSLLVLTLTGNRIGNQGTQRLAQALSFFPLTDEWSRVRNEMVWASFAEDQEDWKQATMNEFRKSFLYPKGKKDRYKKEEATHDVSQVDSCDTLKYNNSLAKCNGPIWINFLQKKGSVHRVKGSSKNDTKYGKKTGSPSRQEANKIKQKLRSDDRKSKEPEAQKCDSDSKRMDSAALSYKNAPSWLQPGDKAVLALGAHPLLQPAIVRGNYIWLPGNRSLISLNLSRNQVGEAGATALLTSMQLQEEDDKGRLLRLELHKNPVSPDCPAIMCLKALMNKRDPIKRVPRINLEKVGIHPCALPISVL